MCNLKKALPFLILMAFGFGIPKPVSSQATSDIQTPVPADSAVILQPGDDFQQANDTNPPGTAFRVAAGVHQGVRVAEPKPGNQWSGEAGAVLDGGGTLASAFSASNLDAIEIRDLTIRNYRDRGIDLNTGSDLVIDGVTILNTGSGSGEVNGAICLFNVSNLSITHCRFERVSSAVLLTECDGPLLIEWNTGINIGRNFVQLDKCEGGDIRVRYNTMERVGDYLRPGADDVEDWISVYKVYGLPGKPAQFNYNRARGHGPSPQGSFIMLGDAGGRYQEAVGNVGVTPGQVGIGIAGGQNIEVRDNKMYSESWPDSNIAFYSYDFSAPEPCGEHVVTGNRANWINRDGVQNTFWTQGVSPLTVENNVFPDTKLGPDIWAAQWTERTGVSENWD